LDTASAVVLRCHAGSAGTVALSRDLSAEIVIATGARPDERLQLSGDEAGTAPEDRRFRPDVQGLRAVGVALVVLFHAHVPGLGGGYVGVDVFFVISGGS
jgi:hypothetical protein